MNTSEYFRDVYRYAESSGWRLSAKQAKEDVYLIRGHQQSDSGDNTLIVMVVTGVDNQVTPEHLEYVYTVGTKTNANTVVVTAEDGLRDSTKQLAENNGIQTLGPSAVPSSTSDRPSHKSQSDTNKSEEPGFIASVTRRRVIASGSVLAGGLLTSGYMITARTQSENTFNKAESEMIPPDELLSNVDQYIGSSVHYSEVIIAQVIETDAGNYQFQLQATKSNDRWKNTMLGQWSGSQYEQGVRVEIWGIVDGTATYETEFGTEQTVVSIDIRDINAL